MTLREADEAAQKRLPVIYQGIEYLRISETGTDTTTNAATASPTPSPLAAS